MRIKPLYRQVLTVWLVFTLLFNQMSQAKAQANQPADINTPSVGQVVGGHTVTRNEVPPQVALYFGNGDFCGGSLIDRYWVMTAGHCTNGQTGVTIYAGLWELAARNTDPQVQSRSGAQIITHPAYDPVPWVMSNDIGLIRLSQPFTLTEAVGLIELANYTQTMTAINANQVITGTGFGVTSENGWDLAPFLQEVDLPLMTLSQCQQYYAGTAFDPTLNNICAGWAQGGKDTCYGDSGGPLADKKNNVWTQYGLTSTGEGCARMGKPGIYTQVANYLQWICQTTQGVVGCDGGTIPPTPTNTPVSVPTLNPIKTATHTPTPLAPPATATPTASPTAVINPLPSATPSTTPTVVVTSSVKLPIIIR